MAIGEQTWDMLVLLTLSCAAFLMMFVGVSTWSDLNQPIQVSSQPLVSAVEMPSWIYHDFVVPEVRDVQDGVLWKERSYFDGFVDFVESQLGNPSRLWYGEQSRSVHELEDESGVVANVKSLFAGIGDSIKSWGQKTISPPAILHATEPLGRFPHSDMLPTSTLASKLTAIVGKVMEAYYAGSVVAEDAKTCSGILEEQTRNLVKSLKHELKEKLCNGVLQAVNEEKFCNFYRSHQKVATLMVFTKLEVDPIGVALMRTTTSEFCASSNGNLVHSVHKMEKLARRLRLRAQDVGQNWFGLHEHEHHEHEHEHEHREHYGIHASHFDVEDEQSCKDCYLQGIHSLMKDIKERLASTCQAPTACVLETCAFVKEHRYLTKTYLVLKIRPWEVISMACRVSCRSSPSYIFPLGMPYYHQTAVSQLHAPNLPRFGHGFIRRLDIEHPELAVADPNMPVSHAAEFDNFILRRSSRCRRLAKLQAFKRAMELRGNVLTSSDSGLEGNGQAHLVVVVNGHPFGPSNIRNVFNDLQNQVDAIVASSNIDGRPEPWSKEVPLNPFHKHWQTMSEWKDSQTKLSHTDFEGHPEHQAFDSFIGDPRGGSLDPVSGEPKEERPSEEWSAEGQFVSVSVEGSDGTGTTQIATESGLEESSSSYRRTGTDVRGPGTPQWDSSDGTGTTQIATESGLEESSSSYRRTGTDVGGPGTPQEEGHRSAI